MITSSGIYRVTVNEANNPTYLKSGVYRVTILGEKEHGMLYKRAEANFRNAGNKGVSLSFNPDGRTWEQQAGTFETVRMLNIFEEQKRVICLPVSESELDAVANSLHGLDWSSLSEAQQIAACKAAL